jgi:thioredoxin-related protein
MPPKSLDDAVQKASAERNPILLEVYAPWCPYCQRMQKKVYADSTVQTYLSKHFTYARLNSDTDGGQHQFDGRTLSTQELASALGARGVPTTVFLQSDGTLIARQPGYIKRPMFLKMIRYIGSGAYQEQSFQAFTGRSQ